MTTTHSYLPTISVVGAFNVEYLIGYMLPKGVGFSVKPLAFNDLHAARYFVRGLAMSSIQLHQLLRSDPLYYPGRFSGLEDAHAVLARMLKLGHLRVYIKEHIDSLIRADACGVSIPGGDSYVVVKAGAGSRNNHQQLMGVVTFQSRSEARFFLNGLPLTSQTLDYLKTLCDFGGVGEVTDRANVIDAVADRIAAGDIVLLRRRVAVRLRPESPAVVPEPPPPEAPPAPVKPLVAEEIAPEETTNVAAQVQNLIAAARNGTPFCEICTAKSAAAA